MNEMKYSWAAYTISTNPIVYLLLSAMTWIITPFYIVAGLFTGPQG